MKNKMHEPNKTSSKMSETKYVCNNIIVLLVVLQDPITGVLKRRKKIKQEFY